MKKKVPDRFEALKKKLTKYLVDNKMRATEERTQILDFVYKSVGHFDVDTLFAYMHDSKFRVSKATLYNTMDIFVKCGIVERLQFNGGAFEYELIAEGEAAHHHLINTNSKKVIEFQDKRIDKIKRELEVKHGVVIDSCQITFYAHNK